MVLTLKNGLLEIKDGTLGSQFSANVRIFLENDPKFADFTPSMNVKYKDRTGELKENTLAKVGRAYIMPAEVYKTSQVVMITVANPKEDEPVISNPIHVRILAGTNGGQVLPEDEETWQSYIDSYLGNKLDEYAKKEDVPELDETLKKSGYAADAKVTGEKIAEAADKVGDLEAKAELTERKVQSLTGENRTSQTAYPSAKAVCDYVGEETQRVSTDADKKIGKINDDLSHLKESAFYAVDVESSYETLPNMYMQTTFKSISNVNFKVYYVEVKRGEKWRVSYKDHQLASDIYTAVAFAESIPSVGGALTQLVVGTTTRQNIDYIFVAEKAQQA